MDLPKVVVAGNVYEKMTEIVEKLGGKSYLDQDNVTSYVLQIDNKYYSAEILLCILKDLSKEVSKESVEGLIICQDLSKTEDNSKLENWSSLITLLSDTEVRLLICDSLSNNSGKDNVMEWCTQKHFELIELECSDLSELEDLETEHNTFGISRIIEALHAHRWPNISLKAQSSDSGPSKNDMAKVSDQLENIALNSNVSDRLKMDSVLDGLMGEEDTDFGELFGELRAMKEHIMSLPPNERKNGAELLVMAFWKAMGGNELDELI